MRKNDYNIIGRRVLKLYPGIAAMVMQGTKTEAMLLDYEDIALLADVFSAYYEIDFPRDLAAMTARDSTAYRLKFTTLCLYCYDPETIKGPFFKRMKPYLRDHIAGYLHTDRSMISQYIPCARVYLRAYSDFENELMQLVGIVKTVKT